MNPRLPAGTRVVWDARARLWRRGSFATGGAPWGVVRLHPQARRVARRLRASGPDGVVPATGVERAAAVRLVDRGLAHPVVEPRSVDGAVTVVVPAHDRPALLASCLASLQGRDVVVVDDGSTRPDEIRRVAAAHGARLVRHAVNRGPAAARNTGLAATDAPLVAFLDSDCVADASWLEQLVPHFDDPRVAAVAPRVVAHAPGPGLLARHEVARSALDMGPRRGLVRYGGAVGFVPSAALVVRRAALDGDGFEPTLRVGEDVDLVWRLVDTGWQVRYEPDAVVEHEARVALLAWARRRYDYGTSAAALDGRHPGRLAPVHLSGWSLLTAGLGLTRRPGGAAAAAVVPLALLGRRLVRVGAPGRLAAVVVAARFAADVGSLGRALRREWWPLGWLMLLGGGRSRVATAARLAMLVPVLLEHRRSRPEVDPLRYLGLRLLEDAAYGSGVIVAAVRHRRPRTLLPRVVWPYLRAASHRGPRGRPQPRPDGC